MSQTISAASRTFSIGTLSVGSVPLNNNIFNSVQIILDTSGLVGLSGPVVIITFSLSNDGGNTFTDYPFTINGGAIRTHGTKFNVGVSVNPGWTNTTLKLTAQTLQVWTSSVLVVIT